MVAQVKAGPLRAWRAWACLLVVFGIWMLYRTIIQSVLDVFFREDYEGLVWPGCEIFPCVFAASLLVLPLSLALCASLGFRRVAIQVPSGLLLNALGFWTLPGEDGESIALSALLFVVLLAPGLCVRWWFRWRLLVPGPPSSAEIERVGGWQFSLADLLVAVATCGIVLALFHLGLSLGRSVWEHPWLLPFGLGILTVSAAPCYSLAWIVLADRRARRWALAVCILTSMLFVVVCLSRVAWATRNSQLLQVGWILSFVAIILLFYVTAMGGVALVLISLRLAGFRLLRLTSRPTPAASFSNAKDPRSNPDTS